MNIFPMISPSGHPQVRVCEGAKLVMKPSDEVPKPYTIGCGGENNQLSQLTSTNTPRLSVVWQDYL